MATDLGNDWILDNDGDMIIGLNGDYMTTKDKEKFDTLNLYEGYQTMLITLARMAYYVAGEYSPFDIFFGAGGEGLISQPIVLRFPEYRERLTELILADDRFQSVNEISYEKIGENVYKILVKVVVRGTNIETVGEVAISSN